MLRPLHFVGSSHRDLKAFPPDARTQTGFALYEAQIGEKASNAFLLVGFGGVKVLEIIVDQDGDTFRGVYTVKFAKAVYVLHCFKKKSKRGIATPQADLDRIRERLKAAKRQSGIMLRIIGVDHGWCHRKKNDTDHQRQRKCFCRSWPSGQRGAVVQGPDCV